MAAGSYHPEPVAEWAPGRTRRIYLPDLRGTDQYVRMTWHPVGRVVVVSHWDGERCTAASQMDIGDAREVIALLTEALTDASQHTPPATAAPAPTRPGPVQRVWRSLLGRRRRPAAPVVRLVPPSGPVRWSDDRPTGTV